MFSSYRGTELFLYSSVYTEKGPNPELAKFPSDSEWFRGVTGS